MYGIIYPPHNVLVPTTSLGPAPPPPGSCLYALPNGDVYGLPGGGSYALPSCPPVPPVPPEDNEMIQPTDNLSYATINAGAVDIIDAQASNYSLRDLILTINTPVTAATAGNLLIGASGGTPNSIATIPLSELSAPGMIRLGAAGTNVVPQTYFNGRIPSAQTVQISSDVTLTAGDISISSIFIVP